MFSNFEPWIYSILSDHFDSRIAQASTKVVVICSSDTRLKGDLWLPSEGPNPRTIHELAGGTVGLGRVPADLATIADDAGHSLGQFSYRQVGP